MNETGQRRPMPVPDALTEPFWSAVREHRFILPICRACGNRHFYPRSLCPHCGAPDIEWLPALGRGRVYSFTVVQRAPSPAFTAQVPFAVGIVALVEGPHLMSGITGCAPSDVTIGMEVEIEYLDVADGTLPMFRAIESRP